MYINTIDNILIIMEFLILSLDDIPYKLPSSFEHISKYNYKIPINSTIVLEYHEYNINSPHVFRDINCYSDYNKLLARKSVMKPIGQKSYQMGTHYIPIQSYGKLINYEIFPNNVPLYNNIKYNFYIHKVTLYLHNTDTLIIRPKLKPVLYITSSCFYTDHIIQAIECIAYTICTNKYFTTIIYLPKSNSLIDISTSYFIDLNDFKHKNTTLEVLCRLA